MLRHHDYNYITIITIYKTSQNFNINHLIITCVQPMQKELGRFKVVVFIITYYIIMILIYSYLGSNMWVRFEP